MRATEREDIPDQDAVALHVMLRSTLRLDVDTNASDHKFFATALTAKLIDDAIVQTYDRSRTNCILPVSVRQRS